ncbi:MAG: homoserine kinase [Clostridia bacterium]|nr:homoserine kinase [Clostridia bacterium]
MIEIRVPATTANLGPGFDVLGLAIDRYNTFTFSASEKCNLPEDHLVYRAYRHVFQALGKPVVEVNIGVKGDIPISRGLGSSAACIVGGIMGANAILGDPLDKNEILKLATEMEGHPDNVSPAIFGGLMISVMVNDKILVNSMPIQDSIKFIAIVPDFELSTEMARSVLPKMINHKDGIYNVARVSLLLSAFATGRMDLIREGLNDRLHVPFRSELIPGYQEVVDRAYQAGAIGCHLSGAGPTIMCLVDGDAIDFVKELKVFLNSDFPGWNIYEHKMDQKGAIRL